MVKPGSADTRQRLIDATLELVAERGFDGVGVGDIEAGAGLAPRSGALYKYFDSKLAVLEAGLEQHLTAIDDVDADVAQMPVTDAAGEVDALVRWLLAELDRERRITHVIEREGDRLPDLRARMRAGVSDRGYRAAAAFIERLTGAVGADPIDHEALAVILIGAVVNLRRSTWTFGAAPLGLDDERFIDTFTALVTTLLDLRPS
jgi:AcrR family transcriptional regulator